MILASINHKGGTGKSMMSQNLAAAYALKGYRTCIFDTDPSQNTMQWFAGRPEGSLPVEVFSNTRPSTLRKAVLNQYTEDKFDVVIIDSPPSLEKIANEILGLCHMCVVPITPGGHDIWSTEQLAEMVNSMEESFEKKIPCYFLMNRYRLGLKAHEMFLDALESHSEEYGIPILKTKVNLLTAYETSNMSCLTAVEWSDSKAKGQIQKLADEIETIFDAL